jgi:hypothetical protein
LLLNWQQLARISSSIAFEVKSGTCKYVAQIEMKSATIELCVIYLAAADTY